jgi:leucyl/phenylalanyl-tRNA--protein transferase
MFPPLECADDDGLLAIGGELSEATLARAYSSGIFPWPIEGLPLLWFAPPQRAVLFFDEFHVSRRLQRELRASRFQIRIDTNFESVILACAAPREHESGTWITDEIREAYTRLHRAPKQNAACANNCNVKNFGAQKLQAHSIETYCDGELVGGLYGVSLGAYFCGESMFHRASAASKAALIFLVEHLKNRGASWIDIQMMTPLFASFGAREIEREEFVKMLQAAQSQPVSLFD